MLARATGMPHLDAHDDFLRARRAQLAARAGRLLSGRRGRRVPRTLCGAVPSRSARLTVIPVARVVGTLEPTIHFDASFRPASEHVRARWERVALAHRKGAPLPPISVLARPDGYYVVDGRHRVSVARALGHAEIEAWVTRASPVAGLEAAA